MTQAGDFGPSPEESHDALIFDPTLPSVLRTNSGLENPRPDVFKYVAGTQHPTLQDISTYTAEPTSGAITLPSTIPLLRQEGMNGYERRAVYGVDLVLQSQERSTHTMVIGVTGAGKNTLVLDPLRMSAIDDPTQSVVSFSEKASDYGPIKLACRRARKRFLVVNLNDAWRSLGWNPLATKSSKVAFDRIRRFADSARNPLSQDSEFWTQWVKTAFMGGWLANYRSFPALYQLFSLPTPELNEELKSHDNPSSRKLAGFLAGGSHNADTVLASIIGCLSSLLSDSVMRVLAHDELKLRKLFRRPVYLHIELPETALETLRPLVQMLARCVIDELIDSAELAGEAKIPTTVFIDDMPSLGLLLSIERLLTLRSRGIGVVAGVQSLASLELAYGSTARALLDGFANKIVLPGLSQSDAEYFSHCSGKRLVSLPCYEGQNPSFVEQPLLSAAAIRSPDCVHNILGKPATLFLGGLTFQAYLQKSFELPEIARLLREARGMTGRERLRDRRLQLPKPRTIAPKKAGGECDPFAFASTNIHGWSEQRIREALETTKTKLAFADTVGSARTWWLNFEKENAKNLGLVLRVAETLEHHKATLTEFFLAFVYSNTDNIAGVIHYMLYSRLKKREESERRRKSQDAMRMENETAE